MHVHEDFTRVIITFSNQENPFAHLFSAKFVYCSLHTVQLMLTWDPNEIMLRESRYIRDWRGRVVAFTADCSSLSNFTTMISDL